MKDVGTLRKTDLNTLTYERSDGSVHTLWVFNSQVILDAIECSKKHKYIEFEIVIHNSKVTCKSVRMYLL